ncbi:MAG TPA: nuclear transport factor 2 family protein [Acidimicrobiales bacterium]|nr:nuclear transport factor 2 family protein [Acidimicrobiales bacterium]
MAGNEDVEIVRAGFDAYLRQDRAASEALIAPDFVFTSPNDDHIDRDAFFDRCFPTADRLRSQDLLLVTAAGDGDVVVMYEYVLTTGERHRNVEVQTVRDGQITEAQVFFGGRYDAT